MLGADTQTITGGLSHTIVRIYGGLKHEWHKQIPVFEALFPSVLDDIIEETECKLSLSGIAILLNQATDVSEELSLVSLHKVVWVVFNQNSYNLS